MKQISKSLVLELIEAGVTKDRRSPDFNESVGTFHEKLNLSQNAVKRLFQSSTDLQKAYAKKHNLYKRNGKDDEFSLVDDLVGQPEVDEVNEVEALAEVEVEEQNILNW